MIITATPPFIFNGNFGYTKCVAANEVVLYVLYVLLKSYFGYLFSFFFLFVRQIT